MCLAITSRDSTSTSTPPPASPVEISPDSQNIAGTNSSIADSRSNNELLLKLLETGEKVAFILPSRIYIYIKQYLLNIL